jgi:hypothetical protein
MTEKKQISLAEGLGARTCFKYLLLNNSTAGVPQPLLSCQKPLITSADAVKRFTRMIRINVALASAVLALATVARLQHHSPPADDI